MYADAGYISRAEISGHQEVINYASSKEVIWYNYFED